MPLLLPMISVSVNGITTAAAMAIAYGPQLCGCMDRIPGSPPTPIAFAVQLVLTEMTAAIAEPVMPQKNGKLYFRLTPKIAGSVTPR